MRLFIHEFFLALLVVGTVPFVVQLLKEERKPFVFPFARDSEVSYFKTISFYFSVWHLRIHTCLCVCYHEFLFLCVVSAHTYMSLHLLPSVSKQVLPEVSSQRAVPAVLSTGDPVLWE